MRIDILTIFPEMFRGPFEASIIARAVAQGVVQIELHDLRNVRGAGIAPHANIGEARKLGPGNELLRNGIAQRQARTAGKQDERQ